MNKIISTIITTICFCQFCYAQWPNNWGISVGQSSYTLNDTAISIKNKLIGGNIFIEQPFISDGAGWRLEISHFRRNSESTQKPYNISNYSSLKLLIGKPLNSGKPFQFPIFFGFGLNSAKGDFKLGGFGLHLRTGARFYLGQKWGIITEGGWDGYLSGIGGRPVFINHLSLNAGIVYSVFKENKNTK